jgi:hypothetical protein
MMIFSNQHGRVALGTASGAVLQQQPDGSLFKRLWSSSSLAAILMERAGALKACRSLLFRASGKAIPVFEFASSLRRREWLPGAFSFDFVIALVMPAAGMVACRFGALLV